MNGVAALLGAITGLVVALTGLVGAVVTGLKLLRKEPQKAAKTTADLILEAAADGQIDSAELTAIVEAKSDHEDHDR